MTTQGRLVRWRGRPGAGGGGRFAAFAGRRSVVLLVVFALVAVGVMHGDEFRATTPTADGSAVSSPEHPEGASFNPNQIKDIKAADPGAGVNLIQPPSANNMGDARLSYPLEVPPGRGGMQPQLGIGYSSAGGNGWLGVGWNLATPTVSVDTRWGVPRYHTGLETETYTLNGEQLTPVAHRSELQARTAEKVFHTRVESGFGKIVRHGDRPSGYWWEVTDKAGTRMTFGGAANSTLTDSAGNIASWALREIRDANDNFTAYHYTRVEDGGVANASVPGSNLYLAKITYTGHGSTEGRYSVTFQRDRERGEPRRADVSIDARGGFKKVTADLLRRVEVKLDDQLIRAYELNYRTGAFHKTLLASVSQFGEDNRLFNTHNFDYYDDIRDGAGNYDAFTTEAGWSISDDNLGAGIRDGEAGALSSSTAKGAGGHLYVGYGPPGLASETSKVNTAGLKVGHNNGSADGLVALADVNGDNLPDKVFRSGGDIYYRPNQSGPHGQARFGDTPIKLTGLPGISREKTRSGTFGIESYFGRVAAQLDYVSSTTTSDRYFADVNGDGVSDLVNNGGVLFGYLDAQGKPAYSANSGDTPVPVGASGASGTFVGDTTAEFERQVTAFPLLDSVRRWVAPYDGTVSIGGPARLVQDTGPERADYRAADGVRVAVQHNDTELWSQRIGPDDYIAFAPTGTGSVTVRKGDAVYFRVQSILDGRYDTVAWDPVITYTGGQSTDVNGLDNLRFTASRDFTLGGRPSQVVAPVTGTLHLSGDAVKSGPTTDDVTVVISRNGTDVLRRVLPAGASGTAAVDLDIPVTAADKLSWRLAVDSPIDVGKLNWVPRAHYTSAEGIDSVTDADGNPTIVINPPFDLDLYPGSTLSGPQSAWTATATGQVTVRPSIAFDFAGQTPDTRVVFTVKKRGALLAKKVIDITDGVVPADLTVTAAVTDGDELFFDFSTVDTTLLGKLTGQSVTVDGAAVPSALHASVEQGAFAQPYRGWGAIGYQGNKERATTPIVQSDLVLDENYKNSLPDGPQESDVPGFTENPTVSMPKVTVFAPQPAQGRWAGADENTWVAADAAASSRMGLDTIDVTRDADFLGARAVSRKSKTEQVSTTFGAGPFGGSVARGKTRSQVDFLDLNGDQFPDVVGSAGIQYTDPNGSLGGTRGGLGGNVRESESLSYSVSGNAQGSPSRTMSNARGASVPSGSGGANTAKSGIELTALGIGGNLGGGESDTNYDLIDVNGDGLPDRLFANGDAALNLGYSFAAREPWPGGKVNEGDTKNAGVNLGFNTDFYSLAGGLSATLGSSKADESLMDMNGDGLMDRVFASGGNPVAVGLNTGNGFAAPVAFRGAKPGINSDKNASLGGGLYFTFGFCYFWGCLVFNPGADFSTSIGRTEVALRDVNGDGNVDHVKSTKDNELLVSENRTGRTNLLRSVARPMGARFDLEYTRDGNTYDVPQSRWLLTRTVVNDGHPGDGVDLSVSSFRYEQGKYDRLEREFYGYGRVVAEQRDASAGDAVLRSVTSDYRTDSYYTQGLVSRTATTDGAGKMYSESLNTYQLRDVATGAAAAPGSTTARVFPHLTRTDRRFYEGAGTPGKTTYAEMSYDEFGNLVRTLDTADLGTADDTVTVLGYSATDSACRNRNIVGIANLIKTSTAAGVLMRHRESTVDCATADVTQVREYLAGGPAAVTDVAYFADGNLKSVTEPANKTGQRYQVEYGYDTVVGVHIESIVNSFGLRSSATHNLKYGTETTVTDENNQQLRTTYDTVGRIDSVTGPYELPENRYTIDFEYHPESAVPYAITRHVDRTATGVREDTMDTVQFADGLGRLVQTKKDAVVADVAGAEARPVMTVSGRSRFDALGRVTETFYPVTEPKGDNNVAFNAAFDSVPPTRLSYDVLDRATRTVLPDNSLSTLAYGFGTDRSGLTRFETVATDANGKARRTYQDVRARTMSVKEFNPAGGQPVIWTSYAYDALGQLTTVVDDKNNATSSAYDNFGRRTILDSPDAGRTETRYDLAGNVIAKITSKLRAAGKAIEYDYDFDRLTAVRYPTFTANNVSYTYGAPGAPNNGAGRPIEVRDGAGTVTMAYGPLGEVVREQRTVSESILNGPERSYATQYQYDSFNRVLKLSYPDSEVLTYQYNSGGLVERATGVKAGHNYTYLSRLDYDKFDQRLLSETGTGVRTTYAYDPEDRQLATLRSKLADGWEFQNLSYSYDRVGNITSVSNAVPTPHGKPIGGASVQQYGYDDLYRLTSAYGEYRDKDNKTRRYSLSVGYDSVNNTLTKSQRDEIVVGDLSEMMVMSEPAGSTESTVGGSAAYQPVAYTQNTENTGTWLPPVGVIEEPEEDTPLSSEEQAMVTEAAGNGSQLQRKTTYDYGYTYGSGRPHAPSKIGPVEQSYDANGNLVDTINTLPPAPGKRRQFVWDEENRLACNQDHARNRTLLQDPSECTSPQQPATARYVYDAGGERVVKISGQKSIYPNQYFSERNGTGWKHVFVGGSRIATKTVKEDSTYENHIFYFHADQLGSSSFVSDEFGALTEHTEYFAFGETWVSEHPAQPTPVPYQYNGKELDDETGLYYYGARYYNPRTQIWQSPDPALAEYVDGAPNGGVNNPANLGLYSYTYNNPVRHTDPDGRAANVVNTTGGSYIVIKPEHKDIPSGLVIPNITGAEGFNKNAWGGRFHVYRTVTTSNVPYDTNWEAAGQEVVNSPTPLPWPYKTHPATPEGTVNQALPGMGTVPGSYVRSFVVPSPDTARFTDIVVNYTIKGHHVLHEGFVLRYGVKARDGSVTYMSYGEGTSWLQHPMLNAIHKPAENAVWGANQENMIRNLQRKINQDRMREMREADRPRGNEIRIDPSEFK